MESVDRAIDALLAKGRETVAVVLLHAYANADHERQVRDRIRERAPQIAVSISSEISPKFREYERNQHDRYQRLRYAHGGSLPRTP